MNKKLLLPALVLLWALVLTACGCRHENWVDADCDTARTCAACGETEGAPLGHSWAAATCETPKTCEICAETEGEALGHSWAEADCENPKTCSACKRTEGQALGHNWQDATTETPKTCETCAGTEGERIITDPRFTTAATAEIQGKWACDFRMTGDMMGMEGLPGEYPCVLYWELGNDGTMVMRLEAKDPDGFNAAAAAWLTESLYAEFAASGIDRATADASLMASQGMDVAEYAAYMIREADLLGQMTAPGVYYVADGRIYRGTDWNDWMVSTAFTLEGDTLIVEEVMEGLDDENTRFTRVPEGE